MDCRKCRCWLDRGGVAVGHEDATECGDLRDVCMCAAADPMGWEALTHESQLRFDFTTVTPKENARLDRKLRRNGNERRWGERRCFAVENDGVGVGTDPFQHGDYVDDLVDGRKSPEFVCEELHSLRVAGRDHEMGLLQTGDHRNRSPSSAAAFRRRDGVS